MAPPPAQPHLPQQQHQNTAGNAAAAAAAATPVLVVGPTDDPNQLQQQQQQPPPQPRRFFPRIKHLLTSDWEYFLQGVVHSLEATGSPYCSSAGQNPNNPWYKAFHSVYGGVAADCSVPTGKNRYHKFKDKIVELWQAIAEEYSQIQQTQQTGISSGPHHWTDVKQMALQQLNVYQQAVQNKASKEEGGGGSGSGNNKKEDKGGAAANASAVNGSSSGQKRRRLPNPVMQQHHQNMKKKKEIMPITLTANLLPTMAMAMTNNTPAASASATLASHHQTIDLTTAAAAAAMPTSSAAINMASHAATTGAAAAFGNGDQSKWKMSSWQSPLQSPAGTVAHAQSQLFPTILQPLQSLQVVLEQCHEYKEHLAKSLLVMSGEDVINNNNSNEAMEEEGVAVLQQHVEEQRQTAQLLFQLEFEQAVESDLEPLLQQQVTTKGEANGHKSSAPQTPSLSPDALLCLLEQWLVGLHCWRMNLKLPTSLKLSLIQPTYQQVFEAYIALRKQHQPVVGKKMGVAAKNHDKDDNNHEEEEEEQEDYDNDDDDGNEHGKHDDEDDDERFYNAEDSKQHEDCEEDATPTRGASSNNNNNNNKSPSKSGGGGGSSSKVMASV